MLPPAVLRALVITLALVLTAAAASTAAAAPATLQLGFFDGLFNQDGPERAPWLDRASTEGADVIRLDAGWRAARKPADPANPADPAYDFTATDTAVRAVVSHGMTPLLGFTGAPTWAEGPDRPASAPPGSWLPDPQALQAYGTALARRYSGTFPDPANPGQSLPRVRYFQVWNEPNLAKYLSPQWERRGPRWVPAAPKHYRAMLNAFYAGVKAVRRDATVVTAGTAPFGDPAAGGSRIMPVRFWREVLKAPARFDALAHHPYGVRNPTSTALNADDVTVPDLGKLRALLRATGHRQPLWVTEISYDSSPPDPAGVPAAKHARWLAEAFYELWHAGVRTVLWFQIRDQAPLPSYAATYQSGTFLRDGTPKLAATAFSFPFVVVPHGRRMTLWTRAPKAGRVVFERRMAGRWRTVATCAARRHHVVLTSVTVSRTTRLRARISGASSLTASGAAFGT